MSAESTNSQHDPQLLRGVLPMLILAMLRERESYGYELVERLRGVGLAGLSTGVVYPVLSRYERERLLTSHLVASPSGPARRYYAITERGEAARVAAISNWREITSIAARGLGSEGEGHVPQHG
jgi:PadR family transcriptional regulator, regulatory protein PadR